MNILQMSIMGGVLIAVIAVIRLAALNRLPKKTFLVLWGIVLLRLLVPFSIPSHLSVYNAFGIFFNNNEITESTGTEIFNADETVQTGFPYVKDETVIPSTDTETIRVSGTEQNGKVSGTSVPNNTNISVSPIIIIWIAGAFTLFAFFTVIYIRSNGALRFALPIHDNTLIEKWARENKIPSRIRILRSETLKTPVAVGILRPRIILPKSMDMNNEELLLYVLAHEYCHIRRFDIIWKILCVLALCVHWFNPLVWIMLILLGRDLELACDEAVLNRYGEDKKKFYAYSIINMSEQLSKLNPLYSGFSKNKTAERITAIMKYKKFSIATIVAAVLLIVGITAAFAFDSEDSESKNPENTVSESVHGNATDSDISNAAADNIENSESDTTVIDNSELEEQYNEFQKLINKQSLELTNLLDEQSVELQETLGKQSDELNEYLNGQEQECQKYYDKPELNEEFQALLSKHEVELQGFLDGQEKIINELMSKFEIVLNEFVSKQEKEYNDWINARPAFKDWLKENESKTTLSEEEFQALQNEEIKKIEESRQEFEDKLNEIRADFEKRRQEFETFMEEQRQALEAFTLNQRNELIQRRTNAFTAFQ